MVSSFARFPRVSRMLCCMPARWRQPGDTSPLTAHGFNMNHDSYFQGYSSSHFQFLVIMAATVDVLAAIFGHRVHRCSQGTLPFRASRSDGHDCWRLHIIGGGEPGAHAGEVPGLSDTTPSCRQEAIDEVRSLRVLRVPGAGETQGVPEQHPVREVPQWTSISPSPDDQRGPGAVEPALLR